MSPLNLSRCRPKFPQFRQHKWDLYRDFKMVFPFFYSCFIPKIFSLICRCKTTRNDQSLCHHVFEDG